MPDDADALDTSGVLIIVLGMIYVFVCHICILGFKFCYRFEMFGFQPPLGRAASLQSLLSAAQIV
jgi:hypothetical protein